MSFWECEKCGGKPGVTWCCTDKAARRKPVVPAEWRKHVIEAWACVRKHNHSIPDEVLDEMKARLLASAPVQLPEPDINTANHAGLRVIGYTEHKVRQLLASRSIEVTQ